MEPWLAYLILGSVIAIGVIIFFYLKKKMKGKVDEQQSLVNQHKVVQSILVLEKRKDKVQNANMPKAVIAQIPKIGPQIMDLLCDDAVFDKLPEKKTVQVELAGIFIAGIKKGKK